MGSTHYPAFRLLLMLTPSTMAGKRKRGISLTVESGTDDEKMAPESQSVSTDGAAVNEVGNSRSPASVICLSSGEEDDDDSVCEVPIFGGGGDGGSVEDNDDDAKALRKQVKSQVGGYGVSENRARFFTSATDVICSVCGLLGHFAHDCTEKVEAIRCFLCGRAGHRADNCPQEYCYLCEENGHHAKHCPHATKGRRVSRKILRERKKAVAALAAAGEGEAGAGAAGASAKRARVVYDERAIAPLCYLCGSREHADCSLLRNPRAVLSCSNCGMKGHAGNVCPEPHFERWMHAVRDMDKSARWKRQPRKPRRFEQPSKELIEYKKNFRQELVERVRGEFKGERDRHPQSYHR